MNGIAPLNLHRHHNSIGKPGEFDNDILVIAGPCSAESERQVMTTARLLAEDSRVTLFRAGLWKPRTKPGCFEGVGARGLEWLQKVKRETGLPVATEVANSTHLRLALKAGIDAIWIGARSVTNPFVVQEIADTLRALKAKIPVFVKNPINPDIELWIGAFQRLYNAGIKQLGAIHRGFSVYGEKYYRNSPQWSIPTELRRRYPHIPIICDPSHIGGAAALIKPLSQFALDMGFEGLMIETHVSPSSALSDASQQITPIELQNILSCLKVRDRICNKTELDTLRSEIDSIDAEILGAISRRMSLSRKIGEYKIKHGMTVLQTERHDHIIKSRILMGEEMGLRKEYTEHILTLLHSESVREQLELYRNQEISEIHQKGETRHSEKGVSE